MFDVGILCLQYTYMSLNKTLKLALKQSPLAKKSAVSTVDFLQSLLFLFVQPVKANYSNV